MIAPLTARPYGNNFTMMTESKHISVMPKEVIAQLQPKADGIYVDATLGLAGHAQQILSHIGPKGHLIGIDQDAQSLELAKNTLNAHSAQCTFVQDNFSHIDKILEEKNIQRVDGIILDLGISSFQLDNPERGFSLRNDGPLDMRMNQENQMSAFDLINSLTEKELSIILKDYGEERFHNRIAKNIVRQRSVKPIETTKELSDLVSRSMPFRKNRERIHPATRSFQALRIAVNRELEALEVALDKCICALKPGGRIVVIAFHSLEDRIVKNVFRIFNKADKLRLLVKKPLRPTEQEAEANPRARSARLRAAEKIS